MLFTIIPLPLIAKYGQDKRNLYVLEWQDDFNGKCIDKSVWMKIPRSNGEWARYMSKNERLFEQKKGRIRLYALRNDGIEPKDTARYLTGGISSHNKRTFKYGKIEVRARLHGCQGTWPAIWIMPEDRINWQYPYRAEIDIMECRSREQRVYQTVHTKYTDVLGFKQEPLRQVGPVVNTSIYNVYAVEILPDRLIFSINGSKTMEYPKLFNVLSDDGQFPFGVESYVMLDMQIGGAWVKTVNADELPAYMDIDWIKVYRLKE